MVCRQVAHFIRVKVPEYLFLKILQYSKVQSTFSNINSLSDCFHDAFTDPCNSETTWWSTDLSVEPRCHTKLIETPIKTCVVIFWPNCIKITAWNQTEADCKEFSTSVKELRFLSVFRGSLYINYVVFFTPLKTIQH